MNCDQREIEEFAIDRLYACADAVDEDYSVYLSFLKLIESKDRKAEANRKFDKSFEFSEEIQVFA